VTTADVVGGGPAGLMAAEVLASAGVAVTVHDRMPSLGRKLLLAGRGGLNLTHTEPLDAFLDRYGAARPRLEAAIAAFDPDALRAWCAGLGQEPFVGSSGRVFPSGFRATSLLRAWLARLDGLGVGRRVGHEWTGFDDPTITGDVVVLALGGASWPRTGSNGAWVGPVSSAGIEVRPMRPANCGFAVSWSDAFRERFAGAPLKNVQMRFGERSARGDAIVSDAGIEGGPVYALSAAVRDAIERGRPTTVDVDLRPDLTVDDLTARFDRRRRGDSRSNVLRRAAPACSGDLERRWHRARRGRRRVHAQEAARHVRRRRDARLGGPDGRLPAAGDVQHRGRRRQRRARLARSRVTPLVCAVPQTGPRFERPHKPTRLPRSSGRRLRTGRQGTHARPRRRGVPTRDRTGDLPGRRRSDGLRVQTSRQPLAADVRRGPRLRSAPSSDRRCGDRGAPAALPFGQSGGT
jgi:uncharacterized flavoprotein (TIGR03862 family)